WYADAGTSRKAFTELFEQVKKDQNRVVEMIEGFNRVLVSEGAVLYPSGGLKIAPVSKVVSHEGMVAAVVPEAVVGDKAAGKYFSYFGMFIKDSVKAGDIKFTFIQIGRASCRERV